MKIVTWNVNGVRAREAQVAELFARERPEVVCLQEIKAPASKVPPSLLQLEGYHCLWHGETAYSGIGLHIRKDAAPDGASFGNPPFDTENRAATADVGAVRVASVYVPNGGKDLAAKLRFLEALDAWAAEAQTAGRTLVLCGDLNVTRTDSSTSTPRNAVQGPLDSCPRSVHSSSGCSRAASSTSGGLWTPTTPACSPGGLLGETCGSETSAGASTTCWQASPWPVGPAAVSFSPTLGPATTRRCWPSSTDPPNAACRTASWPMCGFATLGGATPLRTGQPIAGIKLDLFRSGRVLW